MIEKIRFISLLLTLNFLINIMEKILEAKNITKTYPGVVALDSVNFNVYKAKVNVLVGENGAGKSTLMKILSGVEKQTPGSLFLKNKNF